MKTLPGVEAAGSVNRLPLGTGAVQTGPLELEGSALPNERIASTDWRNTTPDYFRAIGIPLVAGRFYTDSDTDTSTRVGMIDERLARLAYPNESPIASASASPSPASPGSPSSASSARSITTDSMSAAPPSLLTPYSQRSSGPPRPRRPHKQDPGHDGGVTGRDSRHRPRPPVYNVLNHERGGGARCPIAGSTSGR